MRVCKAHVNYELEFFDLTHGGNATITTSNGAITTFKAGARAENARLITNAGGTVDIKQAYDTSNTSLPVLMTVGSIEGAGQYLLGINSLIVGGNNLSTEVSGVIASTGGGLQKTGTGTLTLSGQNGYTGATVVNGGGLVVNGSIASSSGLTVNSGAFVGGSGQLPSTAVTGGTLAPGNSIGTITVNGNLTFSGASVYAVDVSPTAADRTNVTGTATLAGSVQATFQPGSYLTRSYTLLSAASRTGRFDTLATTNLPAGFNAALSYTATGVELNLTAILSQAASGSTPAAAPQTAGLVQSLDRYFNGGGALPSAFVSLYSLTGESLKVALNRLAGEVATGAPTASFQVSSQFLNLMLDPFLETRAGGGIAQGRALGFADEGPQAAMSAFAAVPGSVERRWTAWGGMFGAQGKTSGIAAATQDVSARSGGLAAGLDYSLSRNAIVGFALSGGSVNWALNALGSGSGDVAQGGVYGSTNFGNAYLSAALAYGRQDLSTERTVITPGVFDILSARFVAHSISGRAEAGYRFALANAGIAPYVAGQWQTLRTPSYSERDLTGLTAFALGYEGRATTDRRSELGARFDSRMTLNNGAQLVFRARGAWAHAYDPERTFTASFLALPGTGFTVAGATPATDSALASASSELRFGTGVTLSAKFDAEIAARAHVYAGTAALRYNW